jgi:hypothetical protein
VGSGAKHLHAGATKKLWAAQLGKRTKIIQNYNVELIGFD